MSRPAVFLDRDGTLIEDTGYLHEPDKVKLFPGVATALIALDREGYARVVVTNQSGIGRGMYGPAEFRAVQAEIERQLADVGASIDAVYHCPHTPDAGCPCRKPGTALYREAAARLDLDLARSWWVGDRLEDLLAAKEFGGRMILVRTGNGLKHADAAAALGARVVDDLPGAAGILRSDEGLAG